MSLLKHMTCGARTRHLISAPRITVILSSLAPLAARAVEATSTATTSAVPTAAAIASPVVHLSALALDAGGATPWAFSPIWFVLLGVLLPAVLWTALAWKRALEEDPHRLRRAGKRELRRLLAQLHRGGDTPKPVDLHAWFQATAHTWGVRVSTPTEAEVNRSLSALDGDATIQARWRDLWRKAERRLYAVNSTLSPSWVQETTAVASQVSIPSRKHWLPNRMRHWLPPAAAVMYASVLLVCPHNGLLAAEGDVSSAPGASSQAGQQTSQSKGSDVKPTPAQDVKATLAQNVNPSPAQDVKPTPAQDVKATLAENVNPSPAQDVKPTSAQDVNATLAQDVNLTPAQDDKLALAQDVDPTLALDAKPALAQDAKSASALKAAQGPANKALRADWNNWAAHYNIAARQMVQGNVDYAVAHLTAAFLQHPISGDVQDNLRWSLQQAGSMDPTLRRLLYGAWFQRYPVLLSPANWQTVGLFGGLLIGGGLCSWVLAIYTIRREHELRLTGRWAVLTGIAMLAVSVMSWNAWGDLHRPNAAMLVEGINLSPAPTDLVKDRETLPMTAGSLTLSQATFLGWKQVQLVGLPAGKVAGWVRSPYVMPLYATN